ncbi:uncharacterized protein CDV56_108330 [Aspergillus thermomutatus]|uniref:Major facilitator superfamily (MFS) profile domain-containing protein n=1 Tax=Aspergillus thermomutatus TaxID=41047 RepID=A0A397HMT8_ASPTH|nr:uncharacterized protein CDV56_108330 [Aspergillus thermomutatus]RHZ64449.1 hypothetical protein CDV56_108330 [Aspergillus thermomutatus]
MSVEKHVDFDGPDDPLNPLNWPMRKRVYISAILGLSTMVVAFASSIFSAAMPSVMQLYGISREVCTLGISLYVFGFAFGPLFFGPFSELKGRYMPLVISMFGFTIFSFATAVSKDLQSLFILRYFTGFFGSGPLTLAGASFADMFAPEQRGIAIVMFCLMVFIGPLAAPFVGGFTVMNSSLGWRWTAYIPGILGGAVLLLLVVFLEETYQPVILARKADRLRRETGNWSLHARHEELRLDARSIVTEYLALPLKMLVLDPIVTCMCVFASFVYGLLYLFLTAYPIIFQRIHGMNPGVGGLPYLGVIVGQLLGAVGIAATQPWILRKLEQTGGVMMPEWRLPVAIPGAVAFSGGLFWLGWSGYKQSIHWIVPTLSGLLTGFGLLTMFLPSLAYLVEARPQKAASAVAAHTFLRSVAGGVFPLFATYMLSSAYFKSLLEKLDAMDSPLNSPVRSAEASPLGSFEEESVPSSILLLESGSPVQAVWPELISGLEMLREGSKDPSYLDRTNVTEPDFIFFDTSLDSLTRAHQQAQSTTEGDKEIDSDNLLSTAQAANHGTKGVPVEYSTTKTVMATADFEASVGLPRRGRFSKEQIELIRAQVRAAHQHGLLARYTGIQCHPRRSRKLILRVLAQEGVDLIENDKNDCERPWWNSPVLGRMVRIAEENLGF